MLPPDGSLSVYSPAHSTEETLASIIFMSSARQRRLGFLEPWEPRALSKTSGGTEPAKRRPKGIVTDTTNIRAFWQPLTKGLLINAIRREMCLLPLLPIILMSGAWRGTTGGASAIAMRREMRLLLLLLLLLVLMPEAWPGIATAAISAIAMRREALRRCCLLTELWSPEPCGDEAMPRMINCLILMAWAWENSFAGHGRKISGAGISQPVIQPGKSMVRTIPLRH